MKLFSFFGIAQMIGWFLCSSVIAKYPFLTNRKRLDNTYRSLSIPHSNYGKVGVIQKVKSQSYMELSSEHEMRRKYRRLQKTYSKDFSSTLVSGSPIDAIKALLKSEASPTFRGDVWAVTGGSRNRRKHEKALQLLRDLSERRIWEEKRNNFRRFRLKCDELTQRLFQNLGINDESEQCPVCLEVTRHKISSCGHHIHLYCLRRIAKRCARFICPICRDHLEVGELYNLEPAMIEKLKWFSSRIERVYFEDCRQAIVENYFKIAWSVAEAIQNGVKGHGPLSRVWLAETYFMRQRIKGKRLLKQANGDLPLHLALGRDSKRKFSSLHDLVTECRTVMDESPKSDWLVLSVLKKKLILRDANRDTALKDALGMKCYKIANCFPSIEYLVDRLVESLAA